MGGSFLRVPARSVGDHGQSDHRWIYGGRLPDAARWSGIAERFLRCSERQEDILVRGHLRLEDCHVWSAAGNSPAPPRLGAFLVYSDGPPAGILWWCSGRGVTLLTRLDQPGYRTMSQEIVRGLNELLEAERAGVELATDLARVVSKGYAEGELRKFKGDEAWACTGLRGAIIRYGGMPSERISDFAEKVLALGAEGEQLKLLAGGEAWVVKRIDLLLQLGLYSETAAFLMEMRQQHLENMDVCVRRASELAAPPSVPYRGLPFARLREAHDQMFYAA